MTNIYRVRQASSEDLDCLVTFTLAMAWESDQVALNRDTLEQGIQAVLNNAALGTYWLLYAQEEPIGSLLITVEWSDWHNGPYWWIQSLYIQPTHRGGSALSYFLNALEEFACQAECLALRLYVHPHNGRAIRSYEKNGFQPFDSICMHKPLGALNHPVESTGNQNLG